MAILKHIASKSSNYGAALEYLIFKHDELRKTPILDQNGNRMCSIRWQGWRKIFRAAFPVSPVPCGNWNPHG